MVSWKKLPRNVQRTILAMVILSGEATAASSCVAVVTPMVCDPAPPPVTVTPTPTASPTATVTPTLTATPTATLTPMRAPDITPMIFDPAPEPPPAPDSRRIEDARVARGSSAPLPLAEIRSVSIYWDDSAPDSEDGLVFEAASPWSEARYRWTISGGRLDGDGDRVTWVPPAEPGRYLLQVVADWGAVGLAVDALVLVVDQDGGVSVG